MPPKDKTSLRMSHAAVQAKTGKNWQQWFEILDAAGARKMDHKAIAGVLKRRYKVGPWWGQMVAVTYEQARGLREKHQKAGGYEISVSKTVASRLTDLFEAWTEEKTRGRWLHDHAFTIRKATPHKSLRITWTDGVTHLDVNFYTKGDAKSLVVVQHGKLPDAKAAETMKAYWSEALERLKGSLEA